MRSPLGLRIGITLGMSASVALAAAEGHFLVTNDDTPFIANTASFYTIASDGTLTKGASKQTGGNGIAGGFFAADRILVSPTGQGGCIYAADAQSGEIAGIDRQTRMVTGNFAGSATDSGTGNGIGLAANAQYLYASFTTSSTIATFQVQAGCKLTFVGDLLAVGLNGGLVGGMALHHNMLIVTYGDGSIESFDTSSGAPVSNGDAQNSAGQPNNHFPNGIDITSDGHYAIFGDASTVTTVEVSDISSGKLTPTVAYNVGRGWNSGRVSLSPDESLIYISNTSGGGVTAAFFDKHTGKVRKGCTSAPLKGFYTDFAYAGAVATELNTGTGGLLYVAEFGTGSRSAIGVLQYAASGKSCILTEAAGSPIAGKSSSALMSIGVYPPRPF